MIKVDGTQADIIKALRDAGCSVEMIQSATRRAGIPDLLVGRDGRNYLLEVKALVGKRDPKAKPMSAAQVAWWENWRGEGALVSTPEQALRAVGVKVSA
jgi:Holliday junction resolvase